MGKEYRVYTDGGSRGNPGNAASAFVVLKDGKVILKWKKYIGITTNNEAEYKALLYAIKWLLKNKEKLDKEFRVSFFLDSELVVKQLRKEFKIKNENLKKFYLIISEDIKKLKCEISFNYVPRNKNKLADKLVNHALDEKLL